MVRRNRNLSPDNEGDSGDAIREVEDIESMRKVLAEEKEKVEKYLANWQRSEADFINYKRRMEKGQMEATENANINLIKDLLPVLDDLDRALKSANDNSDAGSWVEGVRLISRKLKAILEARGLAEIEAEGKEFDPRIHEAVMCVEGDDGKVIEELQKGYKVHDRVIRPTMAKVGKCEDIGKPD